MCALLDLGLIQRSSHDDLHSPLSACLAVTFAVHCSSSLQYSLALHISGRSQIAWPPLFN